MPTIKQQNSAESTSNITNPRVTEASSAHINDLSLEENDELIEVLENAQQCDATEMIAFLFALCCSSATAVPQRNNQLLEVYSSIRTEVIENYALRDLFEGVTDLPEDEVALYVCKAFNYCFDVLSEFDSPVIPEFKGTRQLVAIPSAGNPQLTDDAQLCFVYWSDLISVPEFQELKYEDMYDEDQEMLFSGLFGWSHILCPITFRCCTTICTHSDDQSSDSHSALKREFGDFYDIHHYEILDDDLKAVTAINSTDRMASYFHMTHSVSIIMTGRFMSLTWADRQGIILSTSFDYAEELPHLLLLLLVLQRFRPEHWGYGLPNRNSSLRVSALDAPFQVIETQRCNNRGPSKHSESIIYFCPFADIIYKSTSLTGRGTWVMGASKLPPIGVKSREDLVAHNDFVVKCSWPQTFRTSEATILQEAHKLSETSSYIKGHIPDLLAVFEPRFPTSTTQTIRRHLNLGTDGARRWRILVLERLVPISTLPESQMILAFFEIFLCHRALWLKQIQHLDISVGNLMWSKSRRTGVLNDFDLSRMSSRIAHPRFMEGNVGTFAYMALDLVENIEGDVTRLYRHDAESFSWCLVELYMSLTRDESLGTIRPRSQSTDVWFQGTEADNGKNQEYRYNIWQSDVWFNLSSPAYPNIGPLAQALASFWNQFHRRRREGSGIKLYNECNKAVDGAQECSIWADLIALFQQHGCVIQLPLETLLPRVEAIDLQDENT